MSDDLSDLLHDAVADVEPGRGIDDIRRRTRTTRPSRYAAGGAVMAAAALVVAGVVGGALLLAPGDDPAVDRAGGQPTAAIDTPTEPAATDPSDARPTLPTETETEPTVPGGPTRTAALYYIGDTPAGSRLFREFRAVADTGAVDLTPITEALAGSQDPDYRSAWPRGSIVGAEIADGRVQVELGATAPLGDDLALQQLERTLAAASRGLPIDWTGPAGAFTVDPDDATLSPISISDPAEGRTVSGAFTARGVAAAFEGTVTWELTTESGSVAASGSARAARPGQLGLSPWETPIDLTGLSPGRYVFSASDGDPSDSAEGGGPTVDTRTVIVQ